MKSIIVLGFALFIISCNNKNTKEKTETITDSLPPVTTDTTSQTSTTGVSLINEIVNAYISIKNNLVNGNATEAAASAKTLSAALSNTGSLSLNAEQQKTLDLSKKALTDHASQIESNSADIEKQRQHFDMLSKEMISLVKSSGNNTTLYLDFCPMYNNNKGASWLSESKEIKNPYYGDKMMKCGVVKEEIQPK